MKTKSITLLMVSLFIVVSMSAQIDVTNQFTSPNTGITKADTTVSITVDGIDFLVFRTSSNNHYYERTSKKGNIYRVYLGYSTNLLFNTKNVYSNKVASQYYILTFNKNGYPKKIPLIKKDGA